MRDGNCYSDDNGTITLSAESPPVFAGGFGMVEIPNAVVLALFAVETDSRKRNALLCAWAAVEVARSYAHLQSANGKA